MLLASRMIVLALDVMNRFRDVFPEFGKGVVSYQGEIRASL